MPAARDPTQVAAIIDRAEVYAMLEPELADLDRVTRRRRLALATFRRLRVLDQQLAPRERP